jgi:hypothetical protein
MRQRRLPDRNIGRFELSHRCACFVSLARGGDIEILATWAAFLACRLFRTVCSRPGALQQNVIRGNKIKARPSSGKEPLVGMRRDDADSQS